MGSKLCNCNLMGIDIEEENQTETQKRPIMTMDFRSTIQSSEDESKQLTSNSHPSKNYASNQMSYNDTYNDNSNGTDSKTKGQRLCPQDSMKNILSQMPSTYKGYLLNNLKEGFGITEWKTIKGYSQLLCFNHSGKANGYGKLINIDGNIYKGEFIDDKPNGFGILQYPSGGIYTGYWENGSQNKVGYETWSDGSSYSGQYYKGKKHGIGNYKFMDNSMYFGEWCNNLIQGYGSYLYPDGRLFHGQWKNNLMCGYGEITSTDNSIFIGFFFKSLKNGFGLSVNRINQTGYIGFWQDDIRNGFGKIVSNNSKGQYCLFKKDMKDTVFKTEEEFYTALDRKHLNSYKAFFKQDYNSLNMYVNINNTIIK